MTVDSGGGMTAVTDSGGGGGCSAHPPASATVTNPDESTRTSGSTGRSGTGPDGEPVHVGHDDLVEYLGEAGMDAGSSTDEDGNTTIRYDSPASEFNDGVKFVDEYDSEGNVVRDETHPKDG